jgi:hypothetical protein
MQCRKRKMRIAVTCATALIAVGVQALTFYGVLYA